MNKSYDILNLTTIQFANQHFPNFAYYYYAHFYASQIKIMLTFLQVMVKIDQEKPLAT